MDPERLFHTGVVVSDVAAAQTRLTELVGYTWCEAMDVEFTVELPGRGLVMVPFHFTYSVQAPRLELVRAVPGTPWEPADSGIHHLGHWSDDVAGEGLQLERHGYELEASACDESGEALFSYHRHPAGPRIELVATSSRPSMERWWASAGLG